MQPGLRAFEDDPCPVTEATLGQMYRSSPQGLIELIAAIPAEVRGILAVYCYRRAHLASIGLAIAATCEEDDLTRHGGNAGAMLYMKSREAALPAIDPQGASRRKVTLASGLLRAMAPLDEEDVEDEDVEPIEAAAEERTPVHSD